MRVRKNVAKSNDTSFMKSAMLYSCHDYSLFTTTTLFRWGKCTKDDPLSFVFVFCYASYPGLRMVFMNYKVMKVRKFIQVEDRKHMAVQSEFNIMENTPKKMI